MKPRHLTEGAITRVLNQRHTVDDVRFLMRHILEICEECKARTAKGAAAEGFTLTPELELLPEDQPDLGEYEAIFSKLLETVPPAQRALAEEKLRAGALWARLRPLTPEARMTVVSTDPAYHTFPVLDRLLSECVVLRSRPVQCHETAALAVVIAGRLDPATHTPSQIADLTARALAELANAARIGQDFRAAAQALQEGYIALERGSGDPLERARLRNYEGSLLLDVGQFERAAGCFETCYEIYDSLGDKHMMGRALVKQAHAVGQQNPEAAVSLLKHAMGYIDARDEPLLELAARHNLTLFLCESGKPDEALSMLEYARPLHEQFPEPRHLLRLAWLEAKILFALSRYQDAAFAFDSVRDAFLTERLDQEYVLASIDLAQALIQLGNTGRAVSLLTQMYGWLEAYGMHDEGLGVLMLAREGLEQGRIVAFSLRALTSYFKRAWIYPLEHADGAGVV